MDLIVQLVGHRPRRRLDEKLDPADVHWAFETAKPMDEMIRRPGVCGPKVDVAAGADEQTRFLAFMGRAV